MLELLSSIGFAGLAVTTAGQVLLRYLPPRSKEKASPAPVTPPMLPTPIATNAATEDDWTSAITAARKVHIRRADVREEKVVLQFVAWMAAEGYSGWHTSDQIWESFRTFAWEQRFEELSRGALLSAVAVEPGVIKRRAYVQKNDTYQHLRPALKGQERAVVYRMPTEAELAAAKHKRALKDADGCQRPRVPKVRLDPGRHQHPRSASAAETGLKNKDLGLPADAFDVAA
jgi:hypothetical protein